MARGDAAFDLLIHDVEVGPVQEGYQPVRLVTGRGNVECRYYAVPGAHRAAIWVGGVGGDWDTPARDLYPRLARELTNEGIASLRVRYRHPTRLPDSVFDVAAGIDYLQHEGVDAMALVGHSLGGAVVIQAAIIFDVVRTVVTLATQSYGATEVYQLAPRCSILLLHGTADTVIPAASSEYIYQLAGEPKRLILYDGAGHNLDEVAEDVHRVVRNWIVEQLREVA